jgi:hypothetical protein
MRQLDGGWQPAGRDLRRQAIRASVQASLGAAFATSDTPAAKMTVRNLELTVIVTA